MGASESWFARDLVIPDSNAWYERLAYTIGSGAPEGRYEVYILLVDKAGKLVSSDASGFEYRRGKGSFASATDDGKPLIGKAGPAGNKGNQFQSVSQLTTFFDKAEKTYKFVKKGSDLKKVYDTFSDVSSLVSDISNDSATLTPDLAEKMGALRVIFFMLDYCSVGGVRCDLGVSKNLLGGLQRLFKLQAEASRQWSMNFGVSNVKLAWKKNRCFMGFCPGAGGNVDLYLSPLETCNVSDNTIWSSTVCASSRQSSKSAIFKNPANYRKLVASNVAPGQTVTLKGCSTYLDAGDCSDFDYTAWPPGIYLVEAVDSATGMTVKAYNTIMMDSSGTYPIQ